MNERPFSPLRLTAEKVGCCIEQKERTSDRGFEFSSFKNSLKYYETLFLCRKIQKYELKYCSGVARKLHQSAQDEIEPQSTVYHGISV